MTIVCKTNDLASHSLLKPATRTLPHALAHCMAACRPGRDIARLLILNRLYAGCTWSQRQECRVELVRCRQAQRGEVLAVVA